MTWKKKWENKSLSSQLPLVGALFISFDVYTVDFYYTTVLMNNIYLS